MTNLEAKQEAIKKAYGEYWENVKDYVDENGWIYFVRSNGFRLDGKIPQEVDSYNGKFRPKSLQGIENNNGWIKIESKDDLPKEEGNYFIVRSNNEVGTSYFIPNNDFSAIDWRNITHYQPIEKPKLPIY